MRTTTAILAAALAAGLGAARPAVADCIQSGSTVTCTGNSPAGFTAGAGVDNLDFRALTGATVGTGVVLNNGNTVTNNGSVSVGDSNGAAVRALDNNTITNHGTIALGNGADGIALDVERNNTIVNTGTISVGNALYAVSFSSNTVLTNSGLITASGAAAWALFGSNTGADDSGATIANSGTIAGGRGSLAFGVSTIVNTGTMTAVAGLAIGIQGNSSSIVNAGRAETGDNSAGLQIRGDQGSITNTNTGTVKTGSTTDGISVRGNAGTIVNSGSVETGNAALGLVIRGDQGSVTNTGTVTVGSTGAGVSVRGIAGTIVNSGRVETGDSTTGLQILGNQGSIANAGTVKVGATTAGMFVGGDAGRIVNSGSVETGDNTVGIEVQGNQGSVTNTGTVKAGSTMTDGLSVRGNGGTIVNRGSVATGNNALGVVIRGDQGAITNAGHVETGDNTSGMEILGNQGSVTNTGTVKAGSTTDGLSVRGNAGRIVNSGSVTTGNNTLGVVIRGDQGSITNTGTVTIGSTGVGLSVQGNAGTIVNSSRVEAGDDAAGLKVAGNQGSITNTGTVKVGSGSGGMSMQGNAGMLANTGRIEGGNDTRGMHLEGNQGAMSNTGTIAVGNNRSAMFAEGTGIAVTNSGVVQTGDVGNVIYVIGASTATNTGTVRGTVFAWGMAGESGATLVNRGAIIVGIDGSGMVGFDSNVINMGSVVVGNMLNQNTGGLIGVGNNISVTNTASGTVTVGNGAIGMGLFGNGSALTNNGAVTVGANGVGMFLSGTGSTLTNTGTVSLGSSAIGIYDRDGVNSQITNTGRIVANGLAIGAFLGNGANLANSGTIVIPTAGFALLQDGNRSAVVVNSGVIDGDVRLVGTGGSTFTNAGQLTISEPWSGAGIQHRIDGVFTQTAAGSLGLRVASTGGSDSLAVLSSQPGTGVANLSGNLKALVQAGLYANTTTYANALTFAISAGRFSSVTTSSPFFSANAVYNATSLDLVLNRIPFNQVQGLSNGGSNAIAVGTALEAGYSPNLTGAAATAYGKLFASTAPNTFQQLAGEIGAAGTNAAFAAFGQYFATVFGQMSGSQGASTAGNAGGNRVALLFGGAAVDSCGVDTCDAPPFRRVTAWAQGFGSGGSVDGNAATGSSRVDMSAGGGAFGLDVQFTPELTAGVTIGTTSSGYNVSGLSSYGSARAIVFGLYGEANVGPAYLDAALGYGYGSYNTTRSVNTGTGGVNELMTASFDGQQYGGRVEVGWRFGVADRAVLTPFAGLLVQAFAQNGYTETSRDLATGNAGGFGLAVQGQTTTSVRSTLGAQVGSSFTLDDGSVFAPRLRVAWAHEFNAVRSMNAALATLAPASTFTVQGAGAAVDAVIVGAGFDLALTPRVRLFAQFDGDFASNARSFAGTGGVKLIW